MAHPQIAVAQKGFCAGLFAQYTEAKVERFRRRIYSNTVRNLEHRSDQQLKDIGVPRGQIKRRAYDSVYHNKPYQH
ncbi:DUF1127 domain-containing protein [Rhodobacteraceae bacterium B1Z28]|uniref:DUF1127 domain-containing protein n=1 Tax=Ruegeria haliotis TaxID=2747601 RepID=A0ABX2PRB6_9RHOB|nr:DUF1127 domain-containing protein [Ruegeria haliotis]